MTEAERALVHARTETSRHFLEFGAGTSTILACESVGPETIDSVESSEDFLRVRVRPHPAVARALESGRLTLHVVDLGETRKWGKPRGSRGWRNWPRYSRGVFEDSRRYDTILIDGRFRVACALNALLSAPDDCVLLVHDFRDRPQYHILLDFFDETARVDTLGEFRKKPDANRDRARRLIRKYQYRPTDRFGLGEIRARLPWAPAGR